MAPVDSMVTVPPVGTAIGAMSSPEHNRFIGCPPIGNEIVPAKHPNVITGSIPVIVLRIGRTFVDAGGVRCESEITVGKVGKKRTGTNIVK